MDLLEIFCASLLALVLATAAWGKLSRPAALQSFVRSLAGFGVPRSRLASFAVAAGVISAEVCCALLIALRPRAGLAAALVLLGAFTVAAARALRSGEKAQCRCFGKTGAPLAPHHLARNGLLMALAALGLVAGAIPSTSQPLPLQLTVAVLGLIPAAAFIRWDDLAFLFTSSKAAS